MYWFSFYFQWDYSWSKKDYTHQAPPLPHQAARKPWPTGTVRWADGRVYSEHLCQGAEWHPGSLSCKRDCKNPAAYAQCCMGVIPYPLPDRAGRMQLAKLRSPTQPRNYGANNFARTISVSYVSQLQRMPLFLKSDHRLQELWSSGNQVFQNQLHPNLKREAAF